MAEAQAGGVEFHLSGVAPVAVERVVDDGGAEALRVGGVDPELVGAAGEGFEVDAGDAILDRELAPVGDAGLAVDFVVDLVGSVFDVEAEGQGDRSLLAVRFAVEEGLVDLLGFPVLKLNGEGAVGCGSQGKDEEARGVHVEPVDGGVVDAAGVGESDAVGHRVDFFGSPAGDREEAAGLVDHDEVFVLEDDGHFTFRMASTIWRVSSMLCWGCGGMGCSPHAPLPPVRIFLAKVS